jgi:hypothetical protein
MKKSFISLFAFLLLVSFSVYSIHPENDEQFSQSYENAISQVVEMVLADSENYGIHSLTHEQRSKVLSKIINDVEIKDFFMSFLSKRMDLEKEYNRLSVSIDSVAFLKDKSVMVFLLSTGLLNLYLGNWLSISNASRFSLKNILVGSSFVSALVAFSSALVEGNWKDAKKNFSEGEAFLAIKEDEIIIKNLLITKIIDAVAQVS